LVNNHNRQQFVIRPHARHDDRRSQTYQTLEKSLKIKHAAGIYYGTNRKKSRHAK